MNDKFMENYRALEAELRLDGLTVLDYEAEIEDPQTQEKLKFCRIARNYLVHNDTEFFRCSKQMIAFIGELTEKIRKEKQTVKDSMKRRKPVRIGESVKSVIPLCARGPVPVVDAKTGKFLFLIDADYIVKHLAQKRSQIERPKRKEKYRFVKKTDLLKGLSGTYIVTSDGTEKGKYVAILQTEK